MSNIEQFVAALSMDNMVDAKEAFEAALGEKIVDKFEAKKVELAAQVSEATKTDNEEIDEASSEGTIRIIDLSDRSQDKVRKELGVDGLPDKGFQVQRMTKGKFVNQGKPYKSRKDAEEVRISGQHSMRFEAKMENSEVLSAAKKLAQNGKDEKTKSFGKGLVDFYEKNKSFTPDQVSGLQNIMKNASFQMAEAFGLNGRDLTKREVQQELKRVNDAIKKLEDGINKRTSTSYRQDKLHLDNLKTVRDELMNAKDHKDS